MNGVNPTHQGASAMIDYTSLRCEASTDGRHHPFTTRVKLSNGGSQVCRCCQRELVWRHREWAVDDLSGANFDACRFKVRDPYRTADGKVVWPRSIAFVCGGHFSQQNGGYAWRPNIVTLTLRYFREGWRTHKSWRAFVALPRYGAPLQ